ncbi:MAG: SDR family oxidoreductase [Anaerolineae bacterium]|nr:SDR family oxidoreductase [Anaerolineae bacterium]
MRVLILGGTKFLGRHIVEAALARGHEVTLFNRGNTNADLFPEVEKLRGDRDGNLSALQGRRWDVAIDPSGYVPRIVRASVDMLANQVEHYTFISSISVYADTTLYGMDESAPLNTLQDEMVEEITGQTYGGLKVLCERAAEAIMPGRVLHVRSGLIVGPNDPTDRFTYWPVRVAMGGEILAPSAPEMNIQIIDVRDQADWIIRMAEARQAGVYNVTGPASPLTIGQLLETCREISGSDTTFTWVPDDFLLEHDVTPFVELPLWVPKTYNGFQSINIQKALDAGLRFRPLEDTVRDTLAWNARRTGDAAGLKLNAGMLQDREVDLLHTWKQQAGQK